MNRAALGRAIDIILLTSTLVLSAGMLNEGLESGQGGIAWNQALLLPIYYLGALVALVEWRRTVEALRGEFVYVLLVGVCALSVLWSESPRTTVMRNLMLLASTFFAVRVARSLSRKEVVRCVVAATIVLASVSAVFVLIRPEFGVQWDGHAGAWRGVFSQKNGLARVMALGVVAGYSLIVGAERRSRDAFVGALAVALCGLIVLLTTSMTAVVAVSIAGVGMILAPRFKSGLLAALLLFVVPVVVLTGVAALSVGSIDDAASMLGRDVTLTGRTVLWALVLADWAIRPWLGFGYGGYWNGWNSPAGQVWQVVEWEPGDSHNGFIDVLLELGLLGGPLFVALVATSAVRSLGQASQHGRVWPVGFTLLFLLYNLTENAALRPTNCYWVLFVVVLFQARASGATSKSETIGRVQTGASS